MSCTCVRTVSIKQGTVAVHLGEMLFHNDVRAHIFLFLLRIALFVSIGVVLHFTQATSVVSSCPALWESMLVILVMKCIRITVCASAVRVINTNSMHVGKCMRLINMTAYTAFFITECATTSKALSSTECMAAAAEATAGHPLIAYVNLLACAWDGAYILSHALYTLLNRL